MRIKDPEFEGREVRIGDVLTLEHPDGSRLVRELLPTSPASNSDAGIAFTGTEKMENRVFIDWMVRTGGWKIVRVMRAGFKPFAAYVDKYGSDIWVTNGDGELRCITNGSSDPKKYEPFTLMVNPRKLADELDAADIAPLHVLRWLSDRIVSTSVDASKEGD